MKGRELVIYRAQEKLVALVCVAIRHRREEGYVPDEMIYDLAILNSIVDGLTGNREALTYGQVKRLNDAVFKIGGKKHLPY